MNYLSIQRRRKEDNSFSLLLSFGKKKLKEQQQEQSLQMKYTLWRSNRLSEAVHCVNTSSMNKLCFQWMNYHLKASEQRETMNLIGEDPNDILLKEARIILMSSI